MDKTRENSGNWFDTCVAMLMRESRRNFKVCPGDYRDPESGLWMCGKCNTPRECYYNGDKHIVVPCQCACRAAEDRAACEEERRRRVAEERLDHAFESRAMREKCFENDDGSNPALMRAAREYCRGFDEYRREGLGLLLWGEYKGTGKSYAAACIVNDLCKQGYHAKMLPVSSILSALSYREGGLAYFNLLKQIDLLVMDDLDAHRKTDWTNEKLFDLIDGRCSAGKPLIITTNMSIAAMKAPTTEEVARIFDRVLGMCHPIHVEGASKRRLSAAARYRENVERFGI